MAIHTFVAGEAFTAAQANFMNVGADSGTYTPTLTGMAIGTGGGAANSASYTFIGGVLFVEGALTFGTSGTTFPTAPTVSLPSGYTIGLATSGRSCGLVSHLDAGTGVRYGKVEVQTSTTVQLYADVPVDLLRVTRAALSTTIPFTWAAGDGMTYAFNVRATGS